ncbi:NAD(P)/FAD-dependent oxidoreductase [Candidatus Mycoplasma haematominutum]|uniref:Thioredoxin reductase n=1 Tax=Candidatus Mycoplasma haematominutum 'Birmingham 1' TaxID=1116213 RepID=G8C370_9MOLU|nr:FAD-dependent oxidoreductase [Candidatus Mycoplasma haematominutum]CCE66768.1 thioredoxin reductase [Candidatus Mycoplasma haematominutum 'Birmingham 1']
MKLWELIIIGGGPAGATAAIYCARACINVLILEKGLIGGKLNKTLFIDNYPGYLDRNGFKLSENIESQLQDLKVTTLIEEVVSIEAAGKHWTVKTKNNHYNTLAVLITTGMREKKLEIENEVEYYSKGVSYCAICEGNLYTGQEVIVVGGGNSALEESLYLTSIASKLKLVHRRREFRGDEILVRALQARENLDIYTPFKPVKILVEADKVVGLEVENTETGERKKLSSAAVFIFIGLLPEIDFLSNLPLKRDERGFIYVDSEMQTNLPGIFAAGDVIHKDLRQIVTAMNDGAIAAISIKNYLKTLRGS